MWSSPNEQGFEYRQYGMSVRTMFDFDGLNLMTVVRNPARRKKSIGESATAGDGPEAGDGMNAGDGVNAGRKPKAKPRVSKRKKAAGLKPAIAPTWPMPYEKPPGGTANGAEGGLSEANPDADPVANRKSVGSTGDDIGPVRSADSGMKGDVDEIEPKARAGYPGSFGGPATPGAVGSPDGSGRLDDPKRVIPDWEWRPEGYEEPGTAKSDEEEWPF